MSRFEYLQPRTLRQAVALLERHGQEARIVAGATDFLVRWRQGTWVPSYVVSLAGIPGLDRVSYSPRGGLRLGALVTVRTLETHPATREHYTALSAAATTFAGLQVRNLATVGGNVCNASPAGDTLPALLAFEAECRIVGPGGVRVLPLDQVFAGPGRSSLATGEVLTELRLPPLPRNTGSLYIKDSPRSAMDIASVGVAAVVSMGGRQVCQEARIALGAVAPTPIRARAAEDLLRGQPVDQDLLHQAAQAAAGECSPIDDIRASASHRRAIVEALTGRVVDHAVRMAQGTSIPFEAQRRLAVEAAS